MKAPAVRLDFATSHMRTTLPGVLLLLLGVGAVAAACLEYRVVAGRKAGLELRLAASVRHSAPNAGSDARTRRLNEDAGRIVGELGTPWTAVLSDLESASRDSAGAISVLSVEPDHDKRRVRINGESKDLGAALAYIGKLQASHSLSDPMLDSHEVVADDKDHPVRFAMTAQWRESQ